MRYTCLITEAGLLKKNSKRIYHNYLDWEEFHAGMWRKVPSKDRARLVDTAEAFTGDAALYGEYMMRVIKMWPNSCEHNLTDRAMNRQAWVGHAACCMATGAPEDVTREAWWRLSEDQQNKANAQADIAIAAWERGESAKKKTRR